MYCTWMEVHLKRFFKLWLILKRIQWLCPVNCHKQLTVAVCESYVTLYFSFVKHSQDSKVPMFSITAQGSSPEPAPP